MIKLGLLTVRWRWVPLHGPNRVPVVRVVALSVDIKQYIHIFRKGILRRVHVGVSQSWVVCLGMLAVNDRVMMGHPTGLLRTYFHRFLFLFLANVHTITDTHNTKVQKVQTPPLFNPLVRFIFYFRSPEIEQDNLFYKVRPFVCVLSVIGKLSEARIN